VLSDDFARTGDREKLGSCLSACVEAGGAHFVRGWGERNRSICDAVTTAWAAVGWAYVSEGLNVAGIEWLRDWRSRSDAEQWILNSRAAALFDTRQYVEVIEVVRHALDNRPAGEQADFLVENGLRAALLVEDEASFHAIYDDYHEAFEHSPREERYASFDALHAFASLLGADSPREIEAVHVGAKRSLNACGWARALWTRYLRRRLPWWWRLRLWFMAIGA
jgi:hypothetical protein